MGLGFTMGLTLIGLIREILVPAGFFSDFRSFPQSKVYSDHDLCYGTGSIPCTGIVW